MHVSDAVRAIEAAARVGDYAVINIGHLEVVPMARLEMIRAELNAPPELVITTELPPQMTLIKRPVLERQRRLLDVELRVGIVEGVRRVCALQANGRRPLTDPLMPNGTRTSLVG